MHLGALCFFAVAFRKKMKRKEREGGVCSEKVGGVGVQAFIFSASHVIFIVNKTHLALLSEQGLAEEASFYRNRRLV